MRLGNKLARNEHKRQKFIKTLFFLKKNNFELIRNITHKMKSLKNLLYLNRDRLRLFIIQDMSYDYKKNDKYRQKQKICTKTMSPQSIEY